MHSSLIFRILFLLMAAGIGAAVVQAQDLGAVQARMEQRVGAVDAAKDRGAAGENNQGFLDARGGATADDQKVISEENSDRRAVYAALAARTKSDAATVGKARARQIAASSKAGVWIQGADGSWAQKK
jgi:uncharacterized protein YdbL (DUF1318 family)